MGNRDKAPGNENLASDGGLWSPSHSSQFHLGEKPQIAIRQKVCVSPTTKLDMAKN